MPFRRIRGRHAGMQGSVSSGQFTTDPGGFKDPLDEMMKRKEDEENDAVHSMTSDFVSYLLSIIRSFMMLLSTVLFYAIATLKREEARDVPNANSTESAEGDGETTKDDVTKKTSDVSRKRYKKVMTVTSIVDTFNSHYCESNMHETSGNELLKLIESKSNTATSSTFPSPTADLIKNVTEKTKTVQSAGTEVDIQSMFYSN